MTKKYKNYGRGVGQFREEHGRATTYLTFLICALLLSALLYVAYWISMKWEETDKNSYTLFIYDESHRRMVNIDKIDRVCQILLTHPILIWCYNFLWFWIW